MSGWHGQCFEQSPYAKTFDTRILSLASGVRRRYSGILLLLPEHACHAVAIRSSDIDYRYSADTYFRPYCLPRAIRHSCLEICARFGLIFAGIDLIYADESFYFLEANPSPGYDYFEKAVGSEVISAALYAVLTRQVARC